MNKTTLRSRPITLRSGYPISSEKINEAFDNLFFDLCNILGTEVPDVVNAGDYKDVIDIMKRYSEGISMGLLGKENESVVTTGNYTKDWRRV
tara:strand:- start:398 stop:673 length:276 start_codon:yes stop_codon:yes gene_type:complete